MGRIFCILQYRNANIIVMSQHCRYCLSVRPSWYASKGWIYCLTYNILSMNKAKQEMNKYLIVTMGINMGQVCCILQWFCSQHNRFASTCIQLIHFDDALPLLDNVESIKIIWFNLYDFLRLYLPYLSGKDLPSYILALQIHLCPKLWPWHCQQQPRYSLL